MPATVGPMPNVDDNGDRSGRDCHQREVRLAYQQGHPTGAHNVPLMHQGSGGMAPNPEFVAVVEANYARDAKIVVGCKSGGRSQRAAMMLKPAFAKEAKECACW